MSKLFHSDALNQLADRIYGRLLFDQSVDPEESNVGYVINNLIDPALQKELGIQLVRESPATLCEFTFNGMRFELLFSGCPGKYILRFEFIGDNHSSYKNCVGSTPHLSADQVQMCLIKLLKRFDSSVGDAFQRSINEVFESSQ